jgi:hypothetical protein
MLLPSPFCSLTFPLPADPPPPLSVCMSCPACLPVMHCLPPVCLPTCLSAFLPFLLAALPCLPVYPLTALLVWPACPLLVRLSAGLCLLCPACLLSALPCPVCLPGMPCLPPFCLSVFLPNCMSAFLPCLSASRLPCVPVYVLLACLTCLPALTCCMPVCSACLPCCACLSTMPCLPACMFCLPCLPYPTVMPC